MLIKPQDSKLELLRNIIFYWLFLNIWFGMFLGKSFYNFVAICHKLSLYDSANFRKKFKFKAMVKVIIKFFLKSVKNWLIRIIQKFMLLSYSTRRLIEALKKVRNKFKSILKFNYNFKLLKILLPIIIDVFRIVVSLVKEILFLNSLVDWIIEWKNLIRLFMKHSTQITYALYIILFGIFGIVLGFLLQLYREYKNINDIYLLYILFLLKIIYDEGFDHILFESNKVDQLSKFCLEPLQKIPISSPKLIFKKHEEIQLPFLVIEEPLLVIETEILWNKGINYKFQLFEFYQNLDKKIKH